MRNVFIILVALITFNANAQELTNSIRGKIVDVLSKEPLPFASIVILNTNPILGTSSDLNGNFVIENIPIGRHNISVSFLGYEPITISEILVTTSKTMFLEIELTENATSLDEVNLTPRIRKEHALNKMSMVSARRLSVEEASRYAGGFDDPARLAASFPGVASSGMQNNAIVIRGNSPKSLQWKIEGVEVPNPNHFANLGSLGGGGLTALSSNLLADSDFLTGAFSSEYNNALSGVFDIRMRGGNNENHEQSFEVGTLGIDFASEGPLSKNKNSTYLVNYRYSTLSLLSSILPDDSAGTNYQDISFKLNFPTDKSGTFSVWGIGLLDRSGTEPEEDPELQLYYQDIEKQQADQYMAAIGLNHRHLLKNSAYISSTIAFTSSGLDMYTKRLNDAAELVPQNKIDNNFYNLTFKSYINKKFNQKHTNRSGFTITNMQYNMLFKEGNGTLQNSPTLVSENGSSTLFSAFSNSLISHNKIQFNLGINTQYFSLNQKHTIEPRLGLKYILNQINTFSFGYGLHSRIEPLNIYFSNNFDNPTIQPNLDLDFSKAHHFVFGYDVSLSEKTHLKIEPYFQYLYNIPTVRNTTESLLNLQGDLFINDHYENLGSGKNYGIELTLERYMNKGFYFLVSGSLFNSQYKTDLESWYDTRYNKNYLLNVLVGKEYFFGKSNQKSLGLNLRLNVQGGDRYSLINDEASKLEQDAVYDETNPFTQQAPTSFLVHATINYAWNKKKSNQKISLKILNATNFEEFQGHRFNLKTEQVDIHNEALFIPNISYKISF